MRLLLLSVILLTLINKCDASLDDTLPKGVASRFLFFPFFIRSPETSWGFGGATAFFFKTTMNEDLLRTSDVNLVALYTLREQTVIVLGSTIFFPGEKEIFRFQSSFSNYPDKFWGLGNSSPKNAVEDYSLKQSFFNPQLLIRLYKKLFIGASIEIQDIRDFTYIVGGIFDTQDVEGRNGGLSSGAGVLFTWDTRNNAYSPSRGMLAEINITGFTDKLGSDFNFTSYMMDLRKFILAGRNRVLGFQMIGKVNQGPAPVRNLSMLGGTEMMRGYYKGRYTDQDMIAFQAELRQYLFWRIGIAGFASAGQVGKIINDFGLNDFHYAYGGGIRLVLKEKEKLNLRIDYGRGQDSYGVYVILKESF